MASQREILTADIRRLTEEREAALHREAQAIQARSRAKELVYQAQAQIDSAHVEAAILSLTIDEQLDALNSIPEQRPAS